MAGSSAKLLQQEGTTRETPLTIGLQRFGLKSLSPAGARARLTILIYHRVLAEPDELLTGEVDARHFDSQMTLIKRLFNVLPLDDAVERLKSMTLPERAVAITFDDGYADNAKIALPILRHHRLPATFFIATGFLERGRMFNDSVIEAVRRAPGSVLDLSPIDLDLHDISNTAARRQTICRLLGNLKYFPRACARHSFQLPSGPKFREFLRERIRESLYPATKAPVPSGELSSIINNSNSEKVCRKTDSIAAPRCAVPR